MATGPLDADALPLADPLAERIRTWLLRDALPFWSAAGVDHVNGGFVEALALDGRPAAVAFKRTRVTARQTYVFAHAATLGYAPGRDVVRHGLAFLAKARCETGYVRLLTPDGKVLDPVVDLYDLAFVLFALAWAARALEDPGPVVAAHRALDALERLRHPSGRGFVNASAGTGPRLQNPHMHLMEAVLALHETAPHARTEALARELYALFEGHLFDARTGALREVFDDDMRPLPPPDGDRIEPGHHFEWAWILARYGRAFARDVSGPVAALVRLAEAHGVDPATGATRDAIDVSGRVVDAGSRAWPNTERVKGAIALEEVTGVSSAPAVGSAWDVLFARYLAGTPPGTWRDAFDGAGLPIARTIPASTLYHLFLAAAETLRVRGAAR